MSLRQALLISVIFCKRSLKHKPPEMGDAFQGNLWNSVIILTKAEFVGPDIGNIRSADSGTQSDLGVPTR